MLFHYNLLYLQDKEISLLHLFQYEKYYDFNPNLNKKLIKLFLLNFNIYFNKFLKYIFTIKSNLEGKYFSGILKIKSS